MLRLIKVLPSGTLSDRDARSRFRKEALTLARLNHSNIATVHEFGTQDQVDFLVTEYIAGITLESKLAGGALSHQEVLNLGVQLLNNLLPALGGVDAHGPAVQAAAADELVLAARIHDAKC